MPTYDYACTACGHEFETFQSMRDDPLRDCPECRESALKRLIGTGAGIIFKGGGFYETDYKRPAEKNGSGEKKEGGESGTADKKSDAKTDKSAAADKTESKPKAEKATASAAS